MPSEKDIAEKFWEKMKSDRTIMLGLEGDAGGGAQPMTALLEDDEEGPVWIFSAKDVDLVQAVTQASKARGNFVSKGHDLFVSFEGSISLWNDQETIERLWNPFVAAWYEGGKTDPKLQLMRLDISHAHIWLNENSLFAGVKLLFGKDPKEEYGDKTADVSF